MKILFVCLGNICRSPTAHGVMLKQLSDRGLNSVEVDSAGTAAYHIGKAPDARTQKAAALKGYDLSGLRARQVSPDDFYEFDHIFAMDEANLSDLKLIQPKDGRATLQLASQFSTVTERSVPDPYYGGEGGFDDVLALCERLSSDIIDYLTQKGGE